MKEILSPTFYRANTKSDVSRLADQCGLWVTSVERIEGRPEYLRLSWPTYVLGAVYERLVNASELFAPWRILLMGTLRKPSSNDLTELVQSAGNAQIIFNDDFQAAAHVKT
jgi:hypothetical protein